jgi:hypothetical protein
MLRYTGLHSLTTDLFPIRYGLEEGDCLQRGEDGLVVPIHLFLLLLEPFCKEMTGARSHNWTITQLDYHHTTHTHMTQRKRGDRWTYIFLP